MCLEGLNHKGLQTSLYLSTGGAALFNCCSDSIRSCDSLPPTISSPRSRGPPHRSREQKNSLRIDKTKIAQEIWESASKGFETENWPQVPIKLSQQIKKTMIAAGAVSKQLLTDSYQTQMWLRNSSLESEQRCAPLCERLPQIVLILKDKREKKRERERERSGCFPSEPAPLFDHNIFWSIECGILDVTDNKMPQSREGQRKQTSREEEHYIWPIRLLCSPPAFMG